MSDCGAVVVCDTRENLDGMEKGFGFSEGEESDLTQRTPRGRREGHRERRRAA
jgi:hypothetical protein